MKYCFTLDLKDDPKLIEEYKKWHSLEYIWKEIPKGIQEAGIKEMEIYLLKNRLFMIIEIENKFILEEQMVKLLKLPRQREWELFMNKFQKPLENPDNPGKWQKMEQIFKLSECI